MDKTFFKFIIVGIINTIVGAGIMFALYNLFHCSYWFSSIMNYVIGSIVSYFLNKYYTFESSKITRKEIIYFSLNIAVCFLIAYGAAKPLALYLLRTYPGKYSYVYRYGNIYWAKLFKPKIYCF